MYLLPNNVASCGSRPFQARQRWVQLRSKPIPPFTGQPDPPKHNLTLASSKVDRKRILAQAEEPKMTSLRAYRRTPTLI